MPGSRRMLFAVAVVVALLSSFVQVKAQDAVQNFVPVRTSTKSYPKVSSRVYAFNSSGLPVALDAITVRENGTDVPPTLVPDPAQPPERLLSLVVAMDVSSTVSSGTPTNLDFMKNAATLAAGLITSTWDELGLSTIDAQANIRLGLTSDKSQFATAVADVRASAGVNMSMGLLSTPLGALTHLQNARNRRALLLFTDGAMPFDLKASLNMARTFGIRVYVICLRSAASADLRALADSTGGAIVDQVTTQADATAWARGFVADAKELRGNTVDWTSTQNCASNVSVSMQSGSITRSTSYTPPATAYRALSLSATGLDFGEPSVGNSVSRSVVVTADRTDITVNRVSVSNPQYTLVSVPSTPFVVRAGQSTSITVRYTAQTVNAVVAALSIETDGCENATVYMRGGSALRGDVLELVSPNGGETFTAGIDTVIRWKNLLPEEIVRLEYSTNAGTSWRTLAEAVNGLTYRWRPGPELSGTMRIRATHTVVSEDKIVVLRGSIQPLYAAVFTEDGQRVITGGDDGTVRIWNPFTGIEERLVGVHSNWVWSLAVMPGQTYVASASYDGTVRVWDYTNGQRIATISTEGVAYSVAFSPDAKTLYIGTQRSITMVSTSNWIPSTVKVVDQGPVYDIKCSKNGNVVAVAEGPSATVRDAQSLEVRTTIRPAGRTAPIYAVAINPAATNIAIGGADFVTSLHSATTGEELATASRLTAAVLAIDFHRDGNSLVVGSGDGTAKIYDATGLGLRSTLTGHAGMVYDAAFSPDGRQVVTASIDFTARAWNIDGIGTVSDQSNANFSVIGSLGTATAIDMGTAVLGTGKDRIATAVSAGGSEPLTILGLNVASGDSTDFAVNTADLPASITAGNPLSLDVSFVPTRTGPRSVDVDIRTGTGVVRVRITGNGTAPVLLGPSIIDFGRRVANQAVVDTSIVLRAPASASGPITVNTTQITGLQAGQYSIVSGGGSFTLTPGQSRDIRVRFEPTDFGRFAAELVCTVPGEEAIRVRLYGEGTGDGRISTTVGLLFPSDPCNQNYADQQIDLTNFGNTELLVFSAGIEGADAADFSVNSANPYPISVAPQAVVPLKVSFRPGKNGPKEARVVITSSAINAVNGRSVVPISARKDSVGFELSRSLLDFANVNEGSEATEKVLIFNTGTLSLRWPRGSTTIGPFRIESITPDVTQPAGKSEFIVRFLGGVAGQTYSETYTFVDSICGSRQTLTMRATVKSYVGATLRIGTARTNTGQEIVVPVYVTRKVNFDRTQATELQAKLVVDGTILTPTQSTPAGTFRSDGMREFFVTVPLRSQDSLATSLTFRTSWGRDTMSAIIIDSLILPDTLTITRVNGGVILDDICKEGGVRLFRLTQQSAGVRVAPLPVQQSTTAVLTTIETGRTRLELYDVAGASVTTLVDRVLQGGSWFIPVNLTGIPNGTYFLVMTTPSQTITERIEVLR